MPLQDEPQTCELQDAAEPIDHWEANTCSAVAPQQSPPDSLLEHILEHAPLVVWRIDQTGRFTYSRGRGLESLGRTPEQFLGTSVFEIYQHDPQIINSMRLALSGQEQQLIVDVNGVYFESWIRPIFESDGTVSGAFGVASDITSRIRAQDSERSSSERFLKAFHASPAGILLSDLETGRILDVNTALCRLRGTDRESLLGRTTLEAGFWPEAAARKEALRNSIEKHEQSRFEFTITTEKGKRRRVRMIVEVIDLDGRPCALSIVRDGRRHRRMQRALRASQQRYQTLTRFAPVGIFHTDEQGAVNLVNDHFLRLFDKPQAEVLGQGWWQQVANADRNDLAIAWEEAIRHRTTLLREFRIGIDPQVRWIELQLEPSTDLGFVGSLTDITRRKVAEINLQEANSQLEKAVRQRTELLSRVSKSMEEQIFERRRTYEDLEKSEERWRSLVECAPDVILLMNREGVIEYINHTNFRPTLGPEKVVGRRIHDFTHQQYPGELDELLNRVFQEGRPITHEAQGPDEQGVLHWYQSHMAPIHYLGGVIGATVIVRDITREKMAYEQLRQTQDRLAHVSRVSMVGEMTAGFAHELGQPLFAISSYINGCLIRLEREQSVPRAIISVMRETEQQAHRAIDVVRRMRDFLHRHEILREPTSLNQIVESAVQLADVGLRRNLASCRMDLDESLPLIHADRIQIMQVLLNLLLNAAEAMAGQPDGRREIIIRTSRMNDDWVRCEVIDEGPGLNAVPLHEIFDAFVTSKPTGLGLGLSISRSIILAHGGKISAENRTSVPGACFTLQLPVSLTR